MRKLLIVLIGFLVVSVFTSVEAATPKKWTFLIYLNGNNSLDEFTTDNIKSMEQVGSNDEVNVIVQWASLAKRKTVRLFIKKSTNPNKITSPVIERLGLVDMGKYTTLEDFIKWGVEHYPAEHYFIDVWNHGGGWHVAARNASPGFHPMDISWDDLSGNSITTEQLGQSMGYAARLMGHKVDLYGSDACLMGMAEVANEMSDSVSYYVGSQELEPGAGWPYAELLTGWEAIPNARADQVAKVLVDEYIKSYEGGSNGTDDATLSAYDLDKLAAFNHAFAELGATIQQLNGTDRARIREAAKHVQSFGSPDYADMLDFVDKLKALHLPIPADSFAHVEATANQLIIANADTPNYKHATGLSIWLPVDDYDGFISRSARYRNLQFNVNTHWLDALNTLLSQDA
ncbi:MAG: hypothetical protein A3E82_03310 [Gammaproteobacteria bacterium RIFCSPHIGHO2_12_FULL_38_11]|nr:MAG: hypothetical protein A3E82_03310 [Gammaproteobacteria bacterium RIFCSPHIGHO2_12_FULL_38_11]